MAKQFVVFGLGRFGGSMVKEFYELGAEVMAIDKNENKVSEYSKYATHAVVANAIDETTLKQLGIRNFDHAFVSFGDNIEASILTSLLLKDLGVSKVWAKAQSNYHQKVLEKIGVDRVIHPERDMAKRIAHHIASEKMIDYIELSEDYSMVELIATSKIHNRTLAELDVRARYGCTVVGIQRGREINASPNADEVIKKEDILLIIGHNAEIARFEAHGL
ncbi:potassium transporter Trk [Bacillus lacus]|uniref:Potassium transporter Trk n=1 Tax=Metabacillus lacus TaxID=1983721 RepID=A0A7X2IYP0_9BACI|nr:potassium transporter Trk [Metabacillus lacus]